MAPGGGNSAPVKYHSWASIHGGVESKMGRETGPHFPSPLIWFSVGVRRAGEACCKVTEASRRLRPRLTHLGKLDVLRTSHACL